MASKRSLVCADRETFRIQLTLFLKELGLPVHDALLLWKREYSIPATTGKGSCQHSWHGNEGRYIYNIRHLYGLEGGKIDYKAHSCSTIQGRSLMCGDVGGCPFVSLDKPSLVTWLSEKVADVSSIEVITQRCQQQHYGQACQQFMWQRLSQARRTRQTTESMSSHFMVQPDSKNMSASGTVLDNWRQNCINRSALQSEVRSNRQIPQTLSSDVNKLVHSDSISETQASGCEALNTENQRHSHTSQFFQNKRIKQTLKSLSSHTDISSYSEPKILSSYARIPSYFLHSDAQTSESESWNERGHDSHSKHTVAPYHLTYESRFCSSAVCEEPVNKRTHQIDPYEVTSAQSHQEQEIAWPSFQGQKYHSSHQMQSNTCSDYCQEAKQFNEVKFESKWKMNSKMRCHTCDLKTKQFNKPKFMSECGINSKAKCQNLLLKSCSPGASHCHVSESLCHKCDCFNLKCDCSCQKCFCQCNKSEHSDHKTDHPDKKSDFSGHRSDCFDHRPDCSCLKSNTLCHESHCNKSDCSCHVSDFLSKLAVDLRKTCDSGEYKNISRQKNKLDKITACCQSVMSNVTVQCCYCDMSNVTPVSCQCRASSVAAKISENGTGNLTTNSFETATSVGIAKTSLSDTSAVCKKRCRSQLGQMKEEDDKHVKEKRDFMCISSHIKKKRLVTSQYQTDTTTSSFFHNPKSVSNSMGLYCPCCGGGCLSLLRALLVPHKPVDSVVDLRLRQHIADNRQNACTCAKKCGNILCGICVGEVKYDECSNGQSSLIGEIITDSSKDYDRKRGNVSDSHDKTDDFSSKEMITRKSPFRENYNDTSFFNNLQSYNNGAVQVGSGNITCDEISVSEICSDKCGSTDAESDSNSDDLFSDSDVSPKACGSPLSISQYPRLDIT